MADDEIKQTDEHDSFNEQYLLYPVTVVDEPDMNYPAIEASEEHADAPITPPDAMDHVYADSPPPEKELFPETPSVQWQQMYPESTPVSPSPYQAATPVRTRQPGRARFPSDVTRLQKVYDAPERASTMPTYDGEPDREPASHRGLWQSVHDWWSGLRGDIGWPDKQQDIQDIMGDVGIDMDVIKKARKSVKSKGQHKRQSSLNLLVGASVPLARPGLGARTISASSVQSDKTLSGTASGVATPSTLRRMFGAGVDAQELSSALRTLKKKLTTNDSKQTKYMKAKAELAHRRNLVLLVVYAFMAYGAPSHRLEEYTMQLFKALEMDGRVNYSVGCMDICFINPIDPSDPMTRTAYTTMVKAQGLDVGACEVAFRVYKGVVAGDLTVQEATEKLTTLIEAPSYYKSLWLVPLYGCASALACTWAFGGYWLDMPVAFLLGTVVGVLQIIVAVNNPLYSNVLEVTACLITSFGARAFASIGGGGAQKYFCFGALAESSIAMILPGFMVLTGSLELQSKSITAGSTRLFYAIMYSLLLGYGMSVGSQLWALADPSAPTSTTCPRSIDPRWKILLVPLYLIVQGFIIRARPHQLIGQVLVGSAGVAVNYFVSAKATTQVADTASALAVGILGNLWARSQHAFAYATVVASIMALVPGGLAAQGGLVAGITSPLIYSSSNGTTAQTLWEENVYRSFSVGGQMIQVALGLAVGVLLSALVVYPFGKKNNALCSL